MDSVQSHWGFFELSSKHAASPSSQFTRCPNSGQSTVSLVRGPSPEGDYNVSVSMSCIPSRYCLWYGKLPEYIFSSLSLVDFQPPSSSFFANLVKRRKSGSHPNQILLCAIYGPWRLLANMMPNCTKPYKISALLRSWVNFFILWPMH